ncbi:MAG TPA: response regulator [Polyangiaceae bacterium]|nr:response regulator [Polyangiaceae bacterium]
MPDEPAPPDGPAGDERGEGGPRVLVVDDNPLFAQATASMLAALGARPELAADGFAALAALARAPFDLILLDWEMPRLDGRRTAFEIRRRFGPTPPIVVVSALTARVRRVLGPASGVDDVLAKPFDSAELEALLARWLPRPPRADIDVDPPPASPRRPR